MAADGSIIIDVLLNGRRAQDDVDNLRNNLNNVGDSEGGINKVKSAIGSIGKAAVIAVGAVTALAAGAVGLALPFVEAAAQAQAATAQFTTVFGELEKQATDTLNDIGTQTNILPDRLKGAFTSIAAFAKTSGSDTASALELSSRATLAAADSAAFYDRSIEDVTESLQSYLKGNFENDTALGISSTETTRNARANALYGKSFNDLSESQKQLTLLSQIEEGNRLSGALGQAAREGTAFENVTGNLRQSLKNLQGELGGLILDPFIDGIVFLTQLIQQVDVERIASFFRRTYESALEFISPLIPFVVGAFENIRGNVGTTVQNLVNFIGSALSIIRDFWVRNGEEIFETAVRTFQTIYDTVSPIVQLIVDYLGEKIEFIKDFFEENGQQIYENISTAFNLILDVINFIMPAIQLVIEIVWGAITNIIDGALSIITGVIKVFNGFLAGDFRMVWEGVKDIFSGAIDFIIGIFTLSFVGGLRVLITNFVKAFITSISGLWTTIIGYFAASSQNIINTISNFVNRILEFIVSLYKGFVGYVKNLVTESLEFFEQLADDAINAVKDLPDKFFEIGKSVITGFINGVKKLNPIPYITDTFKAVQDSVSGLFQINSPSKWMRDYIVGSIAEGGIKGAQKFEGEFIESGLMIGRDVQTGIDGYSPNLSKVVNPRSIEGVNDESSINNNDNSTVYNINVTNDDEGLELERQMRRIQFGV
jgi:hypothetical protein